MTNTSTLGFRASRASEEFAGTINLAVERAGDRSVPRTASFTGVLRLMRPLYLDDSGQVTYIVVNPGGAYFGESYNMDVAVDEGAHLLLASQGATRIYRTPNEPSVQHLSFRLAEGSRLEYVPDQTIAYRDADYRQRTRLTVASDAQAFIGEIVTPGWDPEDTHFTYKGMHLRLDVLPQGGEGLVCVDNVRIKPAEIGHAIEGVGYMEGYSHMGSVLVVGPHTTGDYADNLRKVLEPFESLQIGLTSGSRHGISWLMVRALGSSTDELAAMINAANLYDRSVTTGQGRLHLRRY